MTKRQGGHPFGDHFAVGLQPSPTLTDHDKRLLETLRPAGIILFKGNFRHDAGDYGDWLGTYRKLLADVRDCIGRDRLIVSIDHEGGRVHRAPSPITNYPYAREWAKSSAQVGRAMAIELKSLGVNVTFAPVVDVDSNPKNPVIGPRSFAATPEAVIEAALPFIRAVEAEGVATCPKHFPGHGDTAVDSHRQLPTVDQDLEGLRRRELVPFRATIAEGVRMVMTSHVLFPALDADRPSTMSRAIVTGLLREELGFKGVVITDDIGMAAVSKMFDNPEAAVNTMNAGTDIIDICAYGTDTMRAVTIADNIAHAAQSGAIPRAVLDASRERIAKFLDGLPTYEVDQLPDDIFSTHAAFAPAFTGAEGPRAAD